MYIIQINTKYPPAIKHCNEKSLISRCFSSRKPFVELAHSVRSGCPAQWPVWTSR